MLTYWLKIGESLALSAATVGVIFFWTGLLSALSYLAAVPIAQP